MLNVIPIEIALQNGKIESPIIINVPNGWVEVQALKFDESHNVV